VHAVRCILQDAVHPPHLHLIFGRKVESVTFVEIFFLKVGMEHHWLLLPASRTGWFHIRSILYFSQASPLFNVREYPTLNVLLNESQDSGKLSIMARWEVELPYYFFLKALFRSVSIWGTRKSNTRESWIEATDVTTHPDYLNNHEELARAPLVTFILKARWRAASMLSTDLEDHEVSYDVGNFSDCSC